MVETLSESVALGSQMPVFSLPDAVSGRTVSSPATYEHVATLMMFICNHCPFVKHVQRELGRLGHEYVPRGVAVFAVNANDVRSYPEDAPERMRDFAEANKFNFPYLYDESQNTARAFGAACTPEFFLYDRNLKLAYHGQLDESRPGNKLPVTGHDLRAALDAVLSGAPVSPHQTPSVGCSIKWHHDAAA